MSTLTYLHKKINDEVETGQSDEHQFKIHVGDVVKIKYSANRWTRIHNQPNHDAKEDEQQTQENHWERKKVSICTFCLYCL